MSNRIKAVALLSSGMDSTLSIKLLLEQGIEVIGINFLLPFSNEKVDYAGRLANQLGIQLLKVEAGDDYIEMVRKPGYGYGSNMNPCIDCRIYMLREAKRIAREINARFVITGEVLGERPMSQNMDALRLIERESSLKALILRPLSAQHMPVTIPEREGWVDRARLLAIKGRSRIPQFELAEKYGISGFRNPSGGCLLTYEDFCKKLKKLFDHKSKVTRRDIELLKIGRHFYLPSSHIIVGKNKTHNQLLQDLKSPDDYLFEVLDNPSPITLLMGSKEKEDINLAARLTAKYSDAKANKVTVECRRDGMCEKLEVELSSLEPIPQV